MTQYHDPPFSSGLDPASGRYPEGVSEPSSAERGQPSTTEIAKDQAGELANTARDAGKHVAGVAGEQVGQVASEATHQVKQLVQQTRSEFTEQAATQQQRVASGLRSLSEELTAMARGSEQPGVATDLVEQAAERTNAVASWLQQREPGHVVDEITRFARQRPGAFLAIAAGAGFVVGRLGRGLKAASDDSNDSGDNASSGGSINTPNPQMSASSPQGYATAPPAYRPAPGYDPSLAPGYQQPRTPSYPPPPSSYPPPPPPSYPPPPGHPQGPSWRESAP
jgi:ElaB/YqjD/DUF883 family membrane-anchored ribosome-binding protein